MNTSRVRIVLAMLQASPTVMFLVVVLAFGLYSPRFLMMENLVNILVQSSALAIVATGMTIVLLTAGIDLSVGAIMFLSAIAAGKLVLNGAPIALALAVVPVVGLTCGLVNALFITRLRMIPFIVTLATLYIGRGLGLSITQTRAMNLPESFLMLGSAQVLGVPMPIVLMGLVLLAAHLVLTRTPIGRQVYAVGNDAEAAQKAGIRVGRVLVSAYVASGICAAIGGLLVVAQLAAVSPSLGERWEFDAIAAAVLGGTSLFGGKGSVLPGTLLGAVLIQTIRNGLNIMNADPYLYPLIMATVIFVAVLLDSLRNARLRELRRRLIRVSG
ncbi:ABC transporter permease [soil metagenome]